MGYDHPHGAAMPCFKIDPDNLPTLTGDQRTRLDAKTDADFVATAKADADNPPLTADEMGRIAKARPSQ